MTTQHANENDRLLAVRRCIGLFASVIKSGEPWTDPCQRAYDAAILALSARGAAPSVKLQDPELQRQMDAGVARYDELPKWMKDAATQPPADQRQAAAPASGDGLPRFFIEHGVVHDRKTGKHVRGCGCIALESSADDLLALLTKLENEAWSWRMTAKGFRIASEQATPPAPAGAVLDLLTRLIAQDTAAAAECDAMVARTGTDDSINRELTRDAAQYRQSAYRLGLVVAAFAQPAQSDQGQP